MQNNHSILVRKSMIKFTGTVEISSALIRLMTVKNPSGNEFEDFSSIAF